MPVADDAEKQGEDSVVVDKIREMARTHLEDNTKNIKETMARIIV